MARGKELKEAVLAEAKMAEEQAEIEMHWPLDDMDEEKCM